MMGNAGLQYAMKGGLNAAISGSLQTSGLKAQEKDENFAEVVIAGKEQVEAHEDQIIQDHQEKQHMEQVSKICEMEKEYQKEAFIIPSCSQWFDFTTIHEIEMQTLPEFFCDQFPHKNPETYMNYRNFIIKIYRQNPEAYLSATECRKKLPGDICSIIRLHAFLEHWGLINFNVESCLRPPKIQLGDGGIVNPHVIDAAAKGYINVAEAKKILNIFDQKTNNISDADNKFGPQQNLFIIAARKIKAISTQYSPLCNFCGNVCENNQWYRKITSDEILQKPDKQKSIHDILKSLCQTYILCKGCYSLKNYPKILEDSDFEKTDLASMLTQQFTEDQKTSFDAAPKENDDEELDPEQQVVWTGADCERLIEAISDIAAQNSLGEEEEVVVDWKKLSQEVFAEAKTPKDCIMKFLELPITENMMDRFQSRGKISMVQEQNEVAKQCYPSVMMDTSNPLFSQIGIFARCLEERESIREEKHTSLMQAQQDPVSTRRAAPTQNEAPIEKRQTRRMKGRKNQQEAVVEEKKQDVEPIVNEEQIYLIEPQKRCEAPISDEILDKISIKAVKRSQKLAKRAKKQLEKELNSILLDQMQKV